jgi:hypothetical protein
VLLTQFTVSSKEQKMKDFLEMDGWTSKEVSEFKENGRFHRAESSLERNANAAVGQIIAEGDSWFDYAPAGVDLIACLESFHGYKIDNYGKGGDTLENMIFGTRIERDENKDGGYKPVEKSIAKILKRIEEVKPKVFLFSGGGNDVAGEEFESYLNHNDSGLEPMREQYFDQIVNVVFRKYFEHLIGEVQKASPDTYIITHGYGHTLPTGKGVGILGFNFAGPWLAPAFAKKRIFDSSQRKDIVFKAIDKYNEMLFGLAKDFPKFRYIDLRGMIDPSTDWVNELHLHNSAFARVAECIHNEILSLP